MQLYQLKLACMYALLWDIANGAASRGVFLSADCWSFISISSEHYLS